MDPFLPTLVSLDVLTLPPALHFGEPPLRTFRIWFHKITVGCLLIIPSSATFLFGGLRLGRSLTLNIDCFTVVAPAVGAAQFIYRRHNGAPLLGWKPSMRRLFPSLRLLLVILLSLSSASDNECTASTAEERAALFDYIFNATLNRQAFSNVKNQRLGLDVVQLMHNERRTFVNAETQEDLYFALVRLSNARKDRHLSVKPVEGGLWLQDYWGPRFSQQPPLKETAVRFATDYNEKSVFVSDYAVDMEGQIEIGDKLVTVNDVPFRDYVAALEPYVRYSIFEGFWCKLSERMNQWNYQTPPSFYNGKEMKYTLERQSDGTHYTVVLPFLPRKEITWTGRGQPTYPEFTLANEFMCFTMYVHQGKPVVLLVWHGFDEDLMDDIAHLMDYAQKEDLLDHSLILDATHSRGGSRAPLVIQHLSPKSFKTAFGNLRISDMTEQFIKQQQKYNLGYYTKTRNFNDDMNKTLDDGTWLMDWLETSVLPAVKRGQEYSNNVPFKLSHAPMYSDGILHPASLHFQGRMVALFGPFGGSQVDQFASILVDNELAHTIGMPTGGFSNTWDWSETLYWNNTTPIASYMWSIGHTIRPNGQILEGNPAAMDDYVPQTRENYLRYRNELVARAMHHLGLDND